MDFVNSTRTNVHTQRMRSHWQWLVGAGAGVVTAILVFAVTWQSLHQHNASSGMPAWGNFLGIVVVAVAFGFIGRLGHKTRS